MQNYKILVSYDGTEYFGWQRQPDKRTIQGELEKALFQFKNKQVNVIGAGRTDAGVHAQAQAAHFKADINLNEADLQRALNGQLPCDIRITSLQKAAPDFHARRSARSKIYQYRIYNGHTITPFQVRYVLHWPASLDLKKMQEGAELFIREDDFTPFSSNRLLHPVRKIILSEIKMRKKEIIYTVEANGFLKYMVRTIMGTLLEIGKNRIQPENIEKMFRQKKRSLGSPTAPPQGLCLREVKY